MTKEILISIEGRQPGSGEEPVIVKAKGEYNHVNGSHFIRYEERQTEEDAVIHNMIKISAMQVIISKSGAVQTHMVFDTGEMTRSSYQTPYGLIDLDIKTKSIYLIEKEDSLQLKMEYSLASEGSHLSDNEIIIHVSSANRKPSAV